MSSSGQLSKLVADIRVNVSRIEDYLTANDLPQTSFDLESPLAVQLSQPLEKAREDVLEALTSLHARLLGPVPYLMRLMSPAVSFFVSKKSVWPLA